MNSFRIFLTAATFLVPSAVIAQTVTPPPEEDTPPAALRTPAVKPAPAPTPAPSVATTPGVTWKAAPAPKTSVPAAAASPAPAPAIAKPAPPAPPARVVVRQAPAPAQAAPPPPVAVRQAAPSLPSATPMPPHPPVVVIHRAPAVEDHMRMRDDVAIGAPGPQRERFVMRRQMMGHSDPHHDAARRYLRIERGHRVPGYWMEPRFEIRDFDRYDLYPPMQGGRWIRYYDDALLIDPYGQVIDGQWGMRWDDRDPDWRQGPDGIPEYFGDGDYEPDDGDYGWAEHNRGYGAPGYGRPGYGYGYGGYAYPSAGAITITETITTTAPTVEEKVWYEDVAPRHPRKRRMK